MKNSKRLKGVIITIVILMAFLMALSQLHIPRAESADYDQQGFSLENALEDLKYISTEPHPVGSKWHTNVKNYITGEINEMGLEYEIQKANIKDVDIENILVKVEGTKEDNDTVLILGHYDTSKNSLGAGNNGVGIVTMLEVMRNVANGEKTENDLIFFFTDAESKGILGSKAFAYDHPWSKEVDIAFNFEGFLTGPTVIMETSGNSLWMVKEFKKVVDNPVGYSMVTDMFSLRFEGDVKNASLTTKSGATAKEIKKPTTFKFGTDLMHLKDIGIEGMTLSPVKNYYMYSTELDCYANVNPNTLKQHGAMGLSIVNHFGNIAINKTPSGSATFFNLAKSVFVVYSSKWVMPITIVLILLFGLTLWLGMKEKILTLKGVLIGLGFTLSLVMLAIVGTNMINGLIRKQVFGPNYLKLDSTRTMIAFSNYYFIGLLGLIISVCSYVYGKVLKKVNFYDLMVGACTLWTLLVVVMTLFYKNGSYILAWPTMFAVLSMIYMLKVDKENLNMLEFSAIGIMLALPSIVLTTPLLNIYFGEAVSLGLMHMAMLFVVSGASLIVPYLYFNFEETITEFSILMAVASLMVLATGWLACLV